MFNIKEGVSSVRDRDCEKVCVCETEEGWKKKESEACKVFAHWEHFLLHHPSFSTVHTHTRICSSSPPSCSKKKPLCISLSSLFPSAQAEPDLALTAAAAAAAAGTAATGTLFFFFFKVRSVMQIEFI